MASTISHPVKILEVCHVSPSVSNSLSELSTPLTYFDLLWLKFYPVERLFYYECPDLSTQSFLKTILPNLKDSLSITLSHFLPLAGTLTWTAQLDKPTIIYTPGDSVSFTVAESDDPDHFNILSGDDAREAIECRSLVPELLVSDTKASCIALQVTLFRNKGLCIGITTHHAVFDGKSSTMFMKGWAHLCKEVGLKGRGCVSLSPELIPVVNRDVIDDPAGLDSVFLNTWVEISKMTNPDSNTRSLELSQLSKDYLEGQLRCSFRLTKDDINTLRKKINSWQEKRGKEIVHFSTFCIASAHTLVCMLKAIGIEGIKMVYFIFTADFRTRLDPPIPTNYIGNCVWGKFVELEPGCFAEEYGMAIVAEKMSNGVKDLGKNGLDGAEKWMEKIGGIIRDKGNKTFGVAGSPRFEVYNTDYGWGRPKKVEILSVDRNGSIAMAENIDEGGGIQLGIVLKKAEMEVFASEFHVGVRNSA